VHVIEAHGYNPRVCSNEITIQVPYLNLYSFHILIVHVLPSLLIVHSSRCSNAIKHLVGTSTTPVVLPNYLSQMTLMELVCWRKRLLPVCHLHVLHTGALNVERWKTALK
jgi:hypothetical protein